MTLVQDHDKLFGHTYNPLISLDKGTVAKKIVSNFFNARELDKMFVVHNQYALSLTIFAPTWAKYILLKSLHYRITQV